MLCDGCGRDDGVYHFLTFRDNRIIEFHLCSDCRAGRENGTFASDASITEDEGIQNILEVLVQVNREQDESLYEMTCDVCSTSFREVLKEHLFGCPHCYDVFAPFIFKNTDFHDPKQQKPVHADISRYLDMSSLKYELNEAVRLELFEKAAELRDRLKHFEDNGFYS
jgi:protein arginine kinase activator